MSHRLLVTVSGFYVDTIEQEVVLQMKVSLFDENDQAMKILLHKDYRQTAPVEDKNADGVFRSYNIAFSAILLDLEDDLVAILE